MSSSSAELPTPEGPGSVSGAPDLPAGFADTFTSRYVGAGHWVAEEAPKEMLAALTSFLAAYRDESPASAAPATAGTR